MSIRERDLMMQQILAGLDGSECSLRAAETAADIAAKFGAALHLVNVVRPLGIIREELDLYAQLENLAGGIFEAAEYLAPDYLEAAGERARLSGVNQVAVKTMLGDPAEALIEFTRNKAIDLVVVGSRGRGRLAGLLLGSVSQKLATHAPCPVLIVR